MVYQVVPSAGATKCLQRREGVHENMELAGTHLDAGKSATRSSIGLAAVGLPLCSLPLLVWVIALLATFNCLYFLIYTLEVYDDMCCDYSTSRNQRLCFCWESRTMLGLANSP